MADVTIEQLTHALHQARATANARKNAVDLAYQQIEFLYGDRKRGWEGDFLRRICEAARGDRDGCLTCNGRMEIAGCLPEPHLPAYPELCPDCDSAAPGFAPLKDAPDAR